MIYIPEHTEVSSHYLINMEDTIRRLPKELTDELYNQGIKLMIGKDYEDTYYYLYPSWKQEDAWKAWDPTKPVYEITGSGWIDRRKHMHVGGYFVDRKVIMLQQHVNYYTNTISDYSDNKEEIMRVAFHELGHALDFVYSSAFSDFDGFQTAHKADIQTFLEDDKEKLVYFYRSRSETFAELTAALLGGFTKERAAIMLHKFPKCAEFIREDVLPRLKINLSIEQIRKDIYPGYLKKDDKEGKNAVQKLSSILTIPDLPQMDLA